MLSEFAIYCEGKIVVLICDDHLFIKKTEIGRVFIGDVIEESPYPGTKLIFLIEDTFEDKDWLGSLKKFR